MLTPRWRKIIRDLWINKTRTILVVLSITVGITAIGMVMGSQGIVSRDLPAAFQAINPASATAFTLTAFDEDLVRSIRAMPEVEDASAKRVVIVPFKTAEGNWRNLQLFAIPDFEDIRINKLTPEEGAWPPPVGTILIERSALAPNLGFGDNSIGSDITIKAPNGRERQLTISGTLHDLNQFPPQILQTPYGYISFETLDLLKEPRQFNQLEFIVAENKFDSDHIKEVSSLVQDRLEESGVSVIFVFSPPPGDHPAQSFLDAISTLLIAMGALSLILGGFLIVNTLGAILAQQVRQIGIMKAIGARTPQLTAMYFIMVIVFGLLALIISIPLGALGASGLARIFGTFLNFDVRSFALNPSVILVQAIIALVVPLLAAMIPIVRGTRTTVREAISEQGLGKGQFGTSSLDLFIVGLKRLVPMQRPAQISLRNTFRRKGRLILTLITLSLASVIFISILSIRASLNQTLEEALSYFDYHVQVRFSQPYRIDRLKREALTVQGVQDAESWGFASARRVRPDDSESDNIIIYAPPANSNMIQPVILEGRWIRPDDTNAIVINTEVVGDEEDLQLGSTVSLKINGREQDWVIVGIARSSFPQPALFINYDYLSRIVNEVGQGQAILVKLDEGYASDVVGSDLETLYRDRGYRVEEMQTVDQARSIISLFFSVPVYFLMAMAVLLGIVGGLGLMGTMSINVIERLREIGVMRAIGASDKSVLRIVLLEGVIIGLISWFIGGLLAVPLSKVLTDLVGNLLLQSTPAYIFSVTGTGAWLLIVILLAIISSFLPARGASKVTVREVLSYE